MSQHVIKHVFSWNWAENHDKLVINCVFSIVRIVISRYFGSTWMALNFKTLKKSLPLKRQWFFQCFWSVMMSLPGNNLHLQKIGFSKIDISMIFIEFLKISEFFFEIPWIVSTIIRFSTNYRTDQHQGNSVITHLTVSAESSEIMYKINLY